MEAAQLKPETENRLNNELLSAEPAESSKVDKKPKRNSKDDLTKNG